MSFRSGFIAILGKPNVGKSTLVNRLVGRKVAITSSKPQTTRQRMLGILHGDDYQAVLVDTPGMMLPKNQLHRTMLRAASNEAESADLILWLNDLTHLPSLEDKRVGQLLEKLNKDQPGLKIWQVFNKIDQAKPKSQEAYSKLYPNVQHRYEISALTGQGMEPLVSELVANLPEGPAYFPVDQVTEQNDKLWLAEIIREKVLDLTHQEIPHAVAVTVDELRPAQGKIDGIYAGATIFVERDSQKRIIIGKNGSMLKEIGSLTRQELEKDWQRSLYIELWVKVKKDWRDRQDWLRTLGYYS